MIQRLYIHNFRCLQNFDLPISGRHSTLLVGANGAGKTSVGLALEILQKIARGTNRIHDLVRPSVFFQGNPGAPIRLEIAATLDSVSYEYTLALELPQNFNELRVAEEKLSADGSVIYSRDRAQVLLARTSSERDARFRVDWHLVALPIIQEESLQDPISIFKRWLSRMLILAPVPRMITGDSEGDSLMPEPKVTNFGEWFTGLLTHSPAAYAQIDAYLREVMRDFKDVQNPLVGKDSRSIFVQFHQDQATIKLPFADLSDGEKCFFICAVVLACNHAYGPITCFWDEPDSHLSLSEVGQFVLTLRRSFQGGGQLVVTSHNPEAIRKFSNENTLLLSRRSHLEPTNVRPITEVSVEGDLVAALIRNDIG